MRAVVAVVVVAAGLVVVVPLVVLFGAAAGAGSASRISAVGCGAHTCLVGTTSGEVAGVTPSALSSPHQVLAGPVTALACSASSCLVAGAGIATSSNPPGTWSQASDPAPRGTGVAALGCGDTSCILAWPAAGSAPAGAATTTASRGDPSWHDVALPGAEAIFAAGCTAKSCVVAGAAASGPYLAIAEGGNADRVGGLPADVVVDDVGCDEAGTCLLTGVGSDATALFALRTATAQLTSIATPATQILQAACATATAPPSQGSAPTTTTTTAEAATVVCPLLGISAARLEIAALTVEVRNGLPGVPRPARVAPQGAGAADELACDQGSGLCVCVADGPGGQEVFETADAGVTWHPISASSLSTTATGAPMRWRSLALAASQAAGCVTPSPTPPLWAILLGIAEVESDFGRSNGPGVASGANPDGAEGPMQFLASTFAAYDEPTPPGGATPPSPYDAVDAVYAAARLLCANGAGQDPEAAVFSYNHSASYVDEVESLAAGFAADGPAQGETPVQAAALGVAESLIGVPYVFGGASPSGFDCSGLVWYAYLAAGVSLPRGAASQFATGPQVPVSAIVPGDLVFFSDASGIAHVGIYAGAGEMVDAPHQGADVRYDAFTPEVGAAWGNEVFAGVTAPGGAAP